MCKHCCKKHSKKNHNGCHHNENHQKLNTTPVYGEFIRTFTFSEVPQLPIVLPGQNIVFPIPTVQPKGVTYVEDANRVGLLVPKGTYYILYTLNPSEGSTVDLLVNGEIPATATTSFLYGKNIVDTPPLSKSYLIKAPLQNNNLISFINGGSNLFTLSDIPNTRIGNTSIITHIRIQRIDDNQP